MSEGGATGTEVGAGGFIGPLIELGTVIFGGGAVPPPTAVQFPGTGIQIQEVGGQFFDEQGNLIPISTSGPGKFPTGINLLGEPPIAVTTFPTEPPIAVTEFPSAPTPPPTNVFDIFGAAVQGVINQLPSALSVLGTFLGRPAPGSISAVIGAPTVGAPAPTVGGGPMAFFDSAVATLESLLGAAPAAIGVAQQLGFLPGAQVAQPAGFDPRIGALNLAGPIALPGGARTAGLDAPFIDIVPQGTVCIRPRATGSFRLPSRVDVPVPMADGTMRFTTFKNMGRPILWAGDLAAVKRVRRVASKARRRVGGR